jgi:hypothetical protein
MATKGCPKGLWACRACEQYRRRHQKESHQVRKRSWRAIRLSPVRTLIIQARDLESGWPDGSATARSRSIPVWPKKQHIASVALGPRGSVYDPALAPPDQAGPRSDTTQYWTTGRPALSFQLRTL